MRRLRERGDARLPRRQRRRMRSNNSSRLRPRAGRARNIPRSAAMPGSPLSHDRCWRASPTRAGSPFICWNSTASRWRSALVLRSGDRAFYWKTAYDEAYAEYSPGVQLTLELSRAQQRDQRSSLTDSCAIEGHPMIDRLWTGAARSRRLRRRDASGQRASPRALAAPSRPRRRRLREAAKRVDQSAARAQEILTLNLRARALPPAA